MLVRWATTSTICSTLQMRQSFSATKLVHEIPKDWMDQSTITGMVYLHLPSKRSLLEAEDLPRNSAQKSRTKQKISPSLHTHPVPRLEVPLRKLLVCHVPVPHGKHPNHHGKRFAMSCIWQTAHSNQALAKTCWPWVFLQAHGKAFTLCQKILGK